MKTVTKSVLMLCITLSGAWCYAHGAAGTENGKGDGILIEVKETSSHVGFEKSSAIIPSINGHVLFVWFTENIGQVAIEITTATGTTVQTCWADTPDGLQTYIPNTGDYIITFTLPDGDEYYGEFTVSD